MCHRGCQMWMEVFLIYCLVLSLYSPSLRAIWVLQKLIVALISCLIVMYYFFCNCIYQFKVNNNNMQLRLHSLLIGVWIISVFLEDLYKCVSIRVNQWNVYLCGYCLKWYSTASKQFPDNIYIVGLLQEVINSHYVCI